MIVMMKAHKTVLSLFQQEKLEAESVLCYLDSFSDELYVPIRVDVPMKHSIYNIVKSRGKTYLIFNTLFNSMIALSKSEYEQYETLEFSELDLVGAMVDNGFIIPCSVYEYEYYMYYKEILSSKWNNHSHYTIVPTTKCNARCIYCYEDGVIQQNMTEEIADAIADVIIKTNKEFDITWFGGEPLIKVDLIDQISQKLCLADVVYSSGIITNGSLLTEDMIVNKFPLWNIKWVQITIDGLEQEYLRRKCYCCDTSGLFENLLKNIEILLRNEIHVSIRLNIDKNNMDECVNVAEYLYNRFGEFSYLNVYPAFIAGNKDSVSDENERILCSCRIYDLFPPNENVMTEIPKVNSCYLQQKNAFVIDYDGSILCCERDIGRRNTRICSIYDICSFEDITKPCSTIPDTRLQCKNCAYFPRCLGGCSAENSSLCKYDSCFMEKYKIEYLINRIMKF